MKFVEIVYYVSVIRVVSDDADLEEVTSKDTYIQDRLSDSVKGTTVERKTKDWEILAQLRTQ